PNGGVAMSKLHKEGIRGSETALIHFDNVLVPDEALLGAREGTYPVILDSLSENRVGVAANALGMARAAYEAALAYARDRVVAGKRIGDYQAIGHRLADMAAQIEAARWLVYYGAWRVDRGTLDAATRARIESRLEAFEQRKGSQVAVLMVGSTAPEPIEDFSIRVAEAWKIGRGLVEGQAVDDG
ncbi:MAG: acyl-CoA dehydrogenase family protein, partial [Gammaproteobacteria bacterium]